MLQIIAFVPVVLIFRHDFAALLQQIAGASANPSNPFGGMNPLVGPRWAVWFQAVQWVLSIGVGVGAWFALRAGIRHRA